jgi:ABC-type molybdate transport system substrate-binding protein
MKCLATRALAVLAVTLVAAPVADAAELRILSAGAAKAVIADMIPAFEKASGHKVVIEYSPVGPIMKRLAEGEQRDVVVLSEETMTEAAAKSWTTSRRPTRSRRRCSRPSRSSTSTRRAARAASISRACSRSSASPPR